MCVNRSRNTLQAGILRVVAIGGQWRIRKRIDALQFCANDAFSVANCHDGKS